MAARGTESKAIIANRIKEALADCFIGEADKKLYFQVREGGEDIQVAISMTCPKTMLNQEKIEKPKDHDWSGDTKPKKVDISPEDEAMVAKLMEKLGISD